MLGVLVMFFWVDRTLCLEPLFFEGKHCFGLFFTHGYLYTSSPGSSCSFYPYFLRFGIEYEFEGGRFEDRSQLQVLSLLVLFTEKGPELLVVINSHFYWEKRTNQSFDDFALLPPMECR